MSQELAQPAVKKNNDGSLLLGTGLAVASMILLPALAMRLGLGASLTGALRIALMKASSRAVCGGSTSTNQTNLSDNNCR
jgi:hypothetical protein